MFVNFNGFNNLPIVGMDVTFSSVSGCEIKMGGMDKNGQQYVNKIAPFSGAKSISFLPNDLKGALEEMYINAACQYCIEQIIIYDP